MPLVSWILDVYTLVHNYLVLGYKSENNSGYAWKLPGVNTTSEPIPGNERQHHNQCQMTKYDYYLLFGVLVITSPCPLPNSLSTATTSMRTTIYVYACTQNKL